LLFFKIYQLVLYNFSYIHVTLIDTIAHGLARFLPVNKYQLQI